MTAERRRRTATSIAAALAALTATAPLLAAASPRSLASSSVGAHEEVPRWRASTPTTNDPVDVVEPQGFDLADVVVRSADRTVGLTVWLAATPEQWNRGLMGVTDLGAADGMLFVFHRPAIYRFYMWQTPMPLDIAFIDDSGAVVGWTEMEPCLDASADQCERYAPTTPYLSALEVPRDTLDGLVLDEHVTVTVRRPNAPKSTADVFKEPSR